MKYFRRASLVHILLIILAASQIVKSASVEATLNFPQYCAYHGYPTDTHIIHTYDGYNLKFFRLQGKGQQIHDRQKVVYLQHGLQDSSDTWVVNQERFAPGFALANQGYDVWVGNTRGNYYSSPQLNKKVKDFWDFSFDQMIDYDLPAAFEYIHNVTKKKIHYVGHSQGTLIMFGALSQKNIAIRSLLASFSALGPVAYLTKQQSPIFNILSKTNFLQSLKSLEVQQMFFTNQNTRKILSRACAYDSTACDVSLYQISEKNNTVNNLDRMSVIMGHFPSGSSLKNMMHFQQFIRKERFCKFDYGAKMNKIKYGTAESPLYDLKNIDFPVHLFVGNYDRLADINDSQKLFDQLTNSPTKTLTKLNFGHATFVWGKSLQHIDKIKQIIENS